MDVIEVKKGQVLLAQGQTMGAIYFVVSGLLREFHADGEDEITNSFIFEGSYYLTAFYFGGHIRSSFTVEALEDCNIVSFSMDFFQKADIEPRLLLDVFKEISTLKYKHNLQWKLINGKKSFLEKWEYFKGSNPGLWIRIPQKHLATYFKVTPQYISQLKARRKL
ncbi:MAG: Crp/Fnr family transcriptional regulator [Nitritalea sp.]